MVPIVNNLYVSFVGMIPLLIIAFVVFNPKNFNKVGHVNRTFLYAVALYVVPIVLQFVLIMILKAPISKREELIDPRL